MSKNGVNYKIEKYTYKLKNAHTRRDAELYQNKLKHYHGVNRSGINMYGGEGGEGEVKLSDIPAALMPLKNRLDEVSDSLKGKIDEISKEQNIEQTDFSANLNNLKKFLETNVETNKKNESEYKQKCAENQMYNTHVTTVSEQIKNLKRGDCKVGDISIDTDQFLKDDFVIKPFECNKPKEQQPINQ
jgi:hypothetical protein